MVLGSHLKQKICSTNKTIHFIFLVKIEPKILFEEISKLICPTACGLLTDGNKLMINLQNFEVYIVKLKCLWQKINHFYVLKQRGWRPHHEQRKGILVWNNESVELTISSYQNLTLLSLKAKSIPRIYLSAHPLKLSTVQVGYI